MDVFPGERSALITGAGSTRGIGRATAHRLAREGWSVGLLDVDGPAVADLAEELAQQHGVQAAAAGVDVSDGPAVRAAVAPERQRPAAGSAAVHSPAVGWTDAGWRRSE